MNRLQRYQKRRSLAGCSARCGHELAQRLDGEAETAKKTMRQRRGRRGRRPAWPVKKPTSAPTTAIADGDQRRPRRVVDPRADPAEQRRAAGSASRGSSAARRSTRRWRRPATKLRPIRNRPISEMITVMPANSTARPLVSIASTTDSSTSRPSLQALPVAGDDEQRVVDADAEADHRHHRRREVGHRDDVAGQRHERRADAEAEQGGADRQAHRQHRTEGEDQDDDGGDDAEDLALGQLELAEEVTAVLDLQTRRRPAARRRSPRSSLPSSVTSSKPRSVTSSWAKAIVPSCADLLRVVVRAGDRRRPPARRRSPSGLCERGLDLGVVDALLGAGSTICDEKPARSGLFASSSSWTSFVSLSGSVKSVR